MPDLLVQLTPPSKGSRAAQMSPLSYLSSTMALSPIKRKTSLPSITAGQAKKLRLDPAATKDDSTIEIYHRRTQELLPGERDKICVRVPFDQALDKIHGRFKVCENFVGRA